MSSGSMKGRDRKKIALIHCDRARASAKIRASGEEEKSEKMPVVLVANPKGGVGKSTIAANLAGFFAYAGRTTMLGDLDRQQSAATWLKLRPSDLPVIESW